MCRFHRAVFMALLIGVAVVLFGSVWAQELPPDAEPASKPTQSIPSIQPIQPIQPTPDPMKAEILVLLESEKSEMAVLQERFTAAADEREACEAMRRISELKKGTEVGILRIQLKYARLAENTEAAARIELAIEKMTSPRPQGTPQPRPRPPEN